MVRLDNPLDDLLGKNPIIKGAQDLFDDGVSLGQSVVDDSVKFAGGLIDNTVSAGQDFIDDSIKTVQRTAITAALETVNLFIGTRSIISDVVIHTKPVPYVDTRILAPAVTTNINGSRFMGMGLKKNIVINPGHNLREKPINTPLIMGDSIPTVHNPNMPGNSILAINQFVNPLTGTPDLGTAMLSMLTDIHDLLVKKFTDQIQEFIAHLMRGMSQIKVEYV